MTIRSSGDPIPSDGLPRALVLCRIKGSSPSWVVVARPAHRGFSFLIWGDGVHTKCAIARLRGDSALDVRIEAVVELVGPSFPEVAIERAPWIRFLEATAS